MAAAPIPYLLFLLCFAGLVIGVYPTAMALHAEWFTANSHYSHGYLLLVMSLYFVWERRERIGPSSTLERILGAVVMFGALLGWLLGKLGLILALQYVCLAGALAGLLFSAFGLRSMTQALWPTAIILFAMPIWQYLNAPLQYMATAVVGAMLNPLGITHFLDGTLVELPNGSFEIESGCSGLGFLLTSFSLAMIVAASYNFNPSQYVRLLLVGIVMGLVTNWLRIFIIIYAGYVTDMQTSLIEDHLWLGWVLFAIVVLPVLYVYIGRLEREPQAEAAAQPHIPGFRAPHILFVVAMAVAVAFVDTLDFENADQLRGDVRPSSELHQMSVCGSPCVPWTPQFSGADRETTWLIKDQSAGDVWLYTATYYTEADGRELIYYDNDVHNGIRGLRARDTNTLEYAQAAEGILLGRRFVTLHWYQINDQRSTRRLEVKVRQVLAKLGGDHRASVVGLGTYCGRDCGIALERLEELAPGIRLDHQKNGS